ncbi:MAG: hypothetical protein AAGG51_29250 [Cyanobacteria bacterium P01_G01_bin.54]
MPERLLEQIESVRAGLWGAMLLTLVEGGLLALQTGLAHYDIRLFPQSSTAVAIAVALSSGFLFGIAYRYIVRQDDNPHLRQGAVLAFTGVRWGALLEAHPQWWSEPEQWPGAIAIGLATVVAFGVTRWGLDRALRQGWLKPLSSAPQSTS